MSVDTIILAISLVVLILVAIEIFRSRGQSLLAWGLLLLALVPVIRRL